MNPGRVTYPGRMADSPKPKKKRFAWVGQVRDNYKMTAEVYPTLGWIMLGIFAAIVAVGVGIGLYFGNPWTFGIVAVSLGLLAAMWFFSRRAMSAAYSQVEGQPGGAAAVAQSMRGNWSTTPAVSVTKIPSPVDSRVARSSAMRHSNCSSASRCWRKSRIPTR